jgi:predicted RNA-binding protein YlqC (UPF0109 family)
VHLLVDGSACNAGASPYNNAAFASPATVNLLNCGPNIAGQHTLTVELHNDNHSPVLDANGNQIEARTNFVALTAGTPGISVVSPLEGAPLILGADAKQSVPLDFTVTSFTLKAPNTCAGMANCGHVHLLVDGNACNAAGSPYNNPAVASPAVAYLAQCAQPAGGHVVTLELHNDDHTPVVGPDGRAIQASRAIRTIPAAVSPPTISIESPTAGQAVALGGDAGLVPVSYSVTGFTLRAPGTCDAGNCGHVHLVVDNGACNAGANPYNNAGASGPLDAKLALCADPAGTHTLSLELHNNDHSPVIGGNGQVVSSSTWVTACAPGNPCIQAGPPLNGATISLSDGGYPINYFVENFTLRLPGTCDAGDLGCGHVHLLVDDAGCNAGANPYNNAGASGPILADFDLCAMDAGTHRVTVELHHNDHTPVLDDAGVTIQSSVSLTAQ